MPPTQIGPWLDVRSFDTLNRKRDGTDPHVDWSDPIQEAITYLVSQPIDGATGTLYLPPGKYPIAKPLQIRVPYQGSYAFCSIHIVGDSPGYGSNTFHGTAITTKFSDGPALIIQSGRAVKIENIVFQGKNNWTMHTDANNQPDRDPANMATHYDDANYLLPGVRDNRYSPHAGIAIDPYHSSVAIADRYPGLESDYTPVGAGGGSSALQFHSCEFRDFTVGVGISLNGVTQNAENITFVDCTFGSIRSAIAIGQDQSRNVTARNVNVGGARVAFDCIGYGKGSGNCPSIFGANVGAMKYIFQTHPFGGQVAVTGLYAESLYSVGFFGGGGSADPHVLNGCSFTFAPTPPGKPVLDLRMGTNTPTIFNGCQFGMNGDEPMYFYAERASFNNCNFVGSVDNASRFWNNGDPDHASFSNCSMAVKPYGATLSSILPVANKGSLYNYPMLPGTLFYGVRDALSPNNDSTALRWVSGNHPRLYLGDVVVTINADGTATFPVPTNFVGRVAPGDFINSMKPYQILPHPNETTPVQLVLGKVSAVTSTTITLSHVPKAVVDDYTAQGGGPATFQLFANYLPRVHVPTVGTIDFDNSATDMTLPVGYSNSWHLYDRVRDKQGLILEGTYIANINTDPNTQVPTITLSRPLSGSGKVRLNLYDADVRGVNLTQVF